jgi:hypothetical protein
MKHENHAWMCIWLSLQADPELRDMLIRLARIWIRADIREEAGIRPRDAGQKSPGR